MGSVGASKNRANNEIATRSPRHERRGRIPLGSPEYQQHEVEVEEHQSLEDPLAEMVKILVHAHLSPNSLVDLMVRLGLQEQVPAIRKRPQALVVQTTVKSLKAPSHKKRVFFGEPIPNTLARKGISNVAPSRLVVVVADGQQLAVEIR
ncbi:unnamed protein product [Sphagnum troendelagicum]